MPALVIGPLLRHVATTTATLWVETDAACEVEVLGCTERTFLVGGHHYALVRVEGLAPGEAVAYEVRLDQDVVWPPAGSGRPPSVIRTLHPDRGVRVGFGSCRYAPSGPDVDRDPMGEDALRVYARRMMGDHHEAWPDLFVFLGDQVYADEPSPAIRARIADRRSRRPGPDGEVADFEEYSWLYQESWTDPDVRWLLSTVPTGMIFDDHDVHDDWNTSRAWREDVARTSWWPERVIGALSSYWIYQHLGNLSPAELDEDAVYRAVRSSAGTGQDVEPMLRSLAVAADREADGGKGYRWSFWRDLGRTRLVVLDSRCGRLLDSTRAMMGDKELAWAAERMHADVDHLLVGTSLPWLMPAAIHDLEAWDEQLCDRRWKPLARWGETLRRAADFEHWAAFRVSFERLADLLRDVADGAYETGRTGAAGTADCAGGAARSTPASVCVLSGDVHHSYVCRARYRRDPPRTPVYQLTCSPLHNHVPAFMRLAFRLAWSRPVEVAVRRLLARVARVPRSSLDWDRLAGPWFGNAISTLTVEGRGIVLTVEKVQQPRTAHGPPTSPRLSVVVRRELASPQA